MAELYGGFTQYKISIIGLQGVDSTLVTNSMIGFQYAMSEYRPGLLLANKMLDHVELMLNDPDRVDGEVLKCINYIIDNYKLFNGVPVEKAVEITREFFKLMRGEHLSQATAVCSKSAIETKGSLLQLIKDITITPIPTEDRTHITLITDADILEPMPMITAAHPGIHVRVYVKDYLGRETIREYSNGHQRNRADMNVNHLRELLNLSCTSVGIEPSLMETSNGTMVQAYHIIRKTEESK